MHKEQQSSRLDPVIDVERLMEDVRERAARKRAEGLYGEDPAQLALDDVPPLAPSGDGSLGRLDELALIAGRRDTMVSPRRVVGPLITLARRIAVKLIGPFLGDIVHQINAFHVETLTHLRAREADLADGLARLDANVAVVDERTVDFDAWIAAIGELFDRVRPLEAGVEPMRADIESALRRLGPLATPPRLKTVDEQGRDGIGYHGGGVAAGEALYRGFEDVFRESEDVIRERQRLYVDLLRGHEPVLDIGCGRGELLDLLGQAAISAKGIDADRSMVAHCHAKGHPVELADAIGYLEAQPNESLGAIFSAHVIEHLEYHDLLRFFELSREKLVPGGLFVAETPNPHSMIAFRSFWLDLTHRGPIYPEVAVLLCRLHGFKSADILFPNGTGDLHVDRGESGDYAVVATKAAGGPTTGRQQRRGKQSRKEAMA